MLSIVVGFFLAVFRDFIALADEGGPFLDHTCNCASLSSPWIGAWCYCGAERTSRVLLLSVYVQQGKSETEPCISLATPGTRKEIKASIIVINIYTEVGVYMTAG